MKKLFLFFLSMVCVTVSALAGEYTITFKDSGKTTDQSAAFTTSKDVSTLVTEGAEYLSSIKAVNKVYYAKTGYGIKFGSSSADGSIELGLSEGLKITKVVATACAYNESTASALSVNDSESKALTAELADYTFDFDGTEVSSIKLAATKRLYVTKLVVTVDEGDAPVTGAYETYPADINSKHNQRYTRAINLTCDGNTQTVSDLQTGLRQAIYQDATDQVVTFAQGATVEVKADFVGEWMHGYLWIDYNKDYEFTAELDDQDLPTANSELVGFTTYNRDDAGTWHDSNGNTFSNGAHNAGNSFTITIPANLPEGEYRARFIVDWNAIDPCPSADRSENKLENNGGIMADFTIRVEAAAPATFALTVINNGCEYILANADTYDTIEDFTAIAANTNLTLGIMEVPEGKLLKEVRLNDVVLEGENVFNFTLTEDATLEMVVEDEPVVVEPGKSIIVPAKNGSTIYSFRFDDAPLGEHTNGNTSGDNRSKNFTYSAWIKLKNYTTNKFMGAMPAGWRDNDGLFWVGLDSDGKLTFKSRIAEGESVPVKVGSASTDAGTAADEWVFVSVVSDFEAKKITLYKNGKEISSIDAPEGFGFAPDEANFYIGDNGSSVQFTEVQLWNKALTASELKDSYNLHFTETPANLVAYFKANELTETGKGLRNLGNGYADVVGELLGGTQISQPSWLPIMGSPVAQTIEVVDEDRVLGTATVTTTQPSEEGCSFKVMANGAELGEEPVELFTKLTVVPTIAQGYVVNNVVVTNGEESTEHALNETLYAEDGMNISLNLTASTGTYKLTVVNEANATVTFDGEINTDEILGGSVVKFTVSDIPAGKRLESVTYQAEGDAEATVLEATDGKYSVTVESNATLSINTVEIPTYALTIEAGEATVEFDGEVDTENVYEGSELSFSVNVPEGKVVVSVVYNGQAIQSVAGKYTITVTEASTLVITLADKDVEDGQSILLPAKESDGTYYSFRFDDAPLGSHTNGKNDSNDKRSRNFTYSAWVNVKSEGYVLGNIQSAFSDAIAGFRVDLQGGKLILRGRNAKTIDNFADIKQSEVTYADNVANTNEWMFVTLVADQDNSIVKLYKDGKQVASYATDYGIGLLPDASKFFISDMGCSVAFTEVQLWNKALTDEEIKDSYNFQLTEAPEALVAYYKAGEMVDGSTTRLRNLGNGYADNYAVVLSGKYVVEGWSPKFTNQTEVVPAVDNDYRSLKKVTVAVTQPTQEGFSVKAVNAEGEEVGDVASLYSKYSIETTSTGTNEVIRFINVTTDGETTQYRTFELPEALRFNGNTEISLEIGEAFKNYSVTVVDNGATVTSSVEDLTNIEENTVVSFTVTNIPEGKRLVNVTYNDEVVTANEDGKYVVTVNADGTLKVNIEDIPSYKVTVVANGATVDAGDVDLNAVLEGTRVIVTISAPEGKNITSVTYDGIEVLGDDEGKYAFTVTKDAVLEVNVASVYHLTVINPNGISEDSFYGEFRDNNNNRLSYEDEDGAFVNEGTSVVFAIMPPLTDVENDIDNVTDNGSSVKDELLDMDGEYIYYIGPVYENHEMVVTETLLGGIYGVIADGENAISFNNGVLTVAGEGAKIEVVDINGRVIVVAEGNELNVENLVKGVYVAKASANGQAYTLKFIKF